MVLRIFTISSISIESARKLVERAWGVTMEERSSDYWGEYFNYMTPITLENGGMHAQVYINHEPSGEPQIDELPLEIVLLQLAGEVDQAALGRLLSQPNVKLFEQREVD